MTGTRTMQRSHAAPAVTSGLRFSLSHSPENIDVPGAVRYVFAFDNGYGISAINYGHGVQGAPWEVVSLEVPIDAEPGLTFDGSDRVDRFMQWDRGLAGWLTWAQVEAVLDRVRTLLPSGTAHECEMCTSNALCWTSGEAGVSTPLNPYDYVCLDCQHKGAM